MNKKNIVENLYKNLSKTNDIRLIRSKHRGRDSDWSLSFEHEKGKELDTLVNIFGMRRDKRLENLFTSATSGDGNELSRILTLHSSSLLAFLCFSHINRDCPIKICGTEYVEVMFEIKNDVIDSSLGKPSNIDVVLLNEDRSEILFLESKFTEYLNGGRAYLSPERYEKFFNHLMESKGITFNFKISSDVDHPAGNKKYCLYQGNKTNGYLSGIKQAFGHLLGIATGPAQIQSETNSHYERIFKDVRKITFATIVYNCDNKKFESYSKLYNSVFQKGNEDVIKRSIRKVVDQSKNIDKFTIYPSLLTYQEIFRDYPLPQKIRDFYNFNQHNHA